LTPGHPAGGSGDPWHGPVWVPYALPMTAHADIDALIRKADADYRTIEKEKRADFAGVTAMAGLTILARHIDALTERLDAVAADLRKGISG
jgi:hypothetical protein